MPEGIADSGEFVDAGHESGRSQSGRRRPADVPLDWVFDRRDKIWREPRKPGPKPSDDVDGGPDSSVGDGGGWRADRDPGAAHLSGGNAAEPPQLEVTGEVRDDVEGLLALLAIPVGSLAERRDPYCGAVFAESLPQIVHAAAPIVCRSQTVLRFMTADTGGLMDWLMLAKALAPVATAVMQHHVLKTVQLAEQEEGEQLAERQFAGAAA